MAKRAILTGATGFVGANLARRLLHDGCEVQLLVRPGYAPWRITAIHDDVQLHEINLGDKESLARLVAQIRPDWVFHVAAHGAYSSQVDLDQMIQTNIVATANLLDACTAVGFEAFVNTGSSSEYGLKDHPPAETERVDPNSHYAVTKASATMLCRFAAQRHKLPITILRLYSVYGPFEEPTRLMPTLIAHGLEGRLPPLVDPDMARDFIYVDDVTSAYLLAAEKAREYAESDYGAIYNVGTGVQTTIREVIDSARRVLNIPAEPAWGSMSNRQWDTSVWVADSAKIRAELGWQPCYTFEQGFKLMIEWMQQNLELYRR